MARLLVWRDIGRLIAAGPALADRWGQPGAWLAEAGPRLASHGLAALADRCASLAGRPAPSRWERLGITAREADVLALVACGLPNKEIAARLFLSPRTVEKHVESLLRKTGSRTRTELVAVAGPSDR
jgi:DNA-binding NarL/FixJ family response regulator